MRLQRCNYDGSITKPLQTGYYNSLIKMAPLFHATLAQYLSAVSKQATDVNTRPETNLWPSFFQYDTDRI